MKRKEGRGRRWKRIEADLFTREKRQNDSSSRIEKEGGKKCGFNVTRTASTCPGENNDDWLDVNYPKGPLCHSQWTESWRRGKKAKKKGMRGKKEKKTHLASSSLEK